MSQTTERMLAGGFTRGPVQGSNIVGEVTEAMHRWLLDGWSMETPPPRIEEDLSFVPKDREEVVYVYMYRASQNSSLMNPKKWRPAKISVRGQQEDEQELFYERAPLYLNLFYMVAVHSRFRSEAERLLGWAMMRLYDASHLIYRPRKYVLPNGRVVDSTGQDWSVDADGEEVVMEKVSLTLVDDLTIGDAINFFTINEAPYRPFLTYRAQCAMEGPLLAGPPTIVRHHRAEPWTPGEEDPSQRPNGRIAGGRMDLKSTGKPRGHVGPPGFGHRPIEDNDSED